MSSFYKCTDPTENSDAQKASSKSGRSELLQIMKRKRNFLKSTHLFREYGMMHVTA